jgi:hypothetical protein
MGGDIALRFDDDDDVSGGVCCGGVWKFRDVEINGCVHTSMHAQRHPRTHTLMRKHQHTLRACETVRVGDGERAIAAFNLADLRADERAASARADVDAVGGVVDVTVTTGVAV